MNLVAFEHLDKNRPSTAAHMPLYLLKQHVNLTSLCVTLLYGLSDVAWIITYDWRAGDWLCRAVAMARVVSFYGRQQNVNNCLFVPLATSNIIVIVALHRVLMIARPCFGKNRSYKRVKRMIILAWLLAIVCGCVGTL